MRAIVMETDGKRAVLLKKNGEFADVPDRGYTVGQQVSVSESAPYKKLASLAACFIFAVVSFAMGHNLYYTPASYVYMEINPSIRLEINCFDVVINVVPLNEDATVLLDSCSIKPASTEKCIDEIVKSCKEQRYLNENNNDIRIDVVTNNKKLVTEINKVSENLVKDKLEVAVERVDKKTNEKALEQKTLPKSVITEDESQEKASAEANRIDTEEVFAELTESDEFEKEKKEENKVSTDKAENKGFFTGRKKAYKAEEKEDMAEDTDNSDSSTVTTDSGESFSHEEEAEATDDENRDKEIIEKEPDPIFAQEEHGKNHDKGEKAEDSTAGAGKYENNGPVKGEDNEREEKDRDSDDDTPPDIKPPRVEEQEKPSSDCKEPELNVPETKEPEINVPETKEPEINGPEISVPDSNASEKPEREVNRSGIQAEPDEKEPPREEHKSPEGTNAHEKEDVHADSSAKGEPVRGDDTHRDSPASSDVSDSSDKRNESMERGMSPISSPSAGGVREAEDKPGFSLYLR